MKTLLLFASVPLLLGMCGTKSPFVTETEVALCDEWQAGLALPSRADTPETALWLNNQIAQFEAACQREAF